MNAKRTAIRDRSQSEIIKYLAAPPPDAAAAILALTLVVKPIHLGDLPRFVVPSNERYSFGIPDLQGEQQEECLDRIKPPINEIAFSEKVRGERSVFFWEWV